MDAKTYVKNVLITESKDIEAIRARMSDKNIRLIHASAGIISEVSELFQLSNKYIKGTVLDRTNLMEECGDILWYVGIACDALDSTEAVTGGFDYNVREIKYDDDLSNSIYSTAAKLAELAGEFQDLAIKKFCFYGKTFNAEPLADLLKIVHMNVECLLLESGSSVEQARERNIAKLKARYGEKFTEAAALERNLETERKILETK